LGWKQANPEFHHQEWYALNHFHATATPKASWATSAWGHKLEARVYGLIGGTNQLDRLELPKAKRRVISLPLQSHMSLWRRLVVVDAGIDEQKNKEAPMSDDETKAELERLRKENAALKKGASSGVRLKVSEKGAVSVYGMGRFPVTLYKEQWLKLLDMSDDIRAFISANEAQLKAKE
jgi:hypothetical protein